MTDSELSAPSPSRSGAWIALLALLLLVALAAAGFGGWQLWQARARTEDIVASQDVLLRRLNRQLADTNAEVAALRERQDGLMETVRRTVDDVAALQSRGEESEAAMARLAAAVQGGRIRAELIGIEQLLQLAAERAQLGHDLRGALAAQAAAQERLGRLADPKLLPVRSALAEERTALLAVPQVDVEAAALSLSALIRAARDWPLASRTPRALAGDASPEATAEAPGPRGFWAGLGHALGRVLGTLFVVRRVDHPVDRLLPEAQEALAAELLRLKLETARAALLGGQAQSFRSALGEAIDHLGRYYRSDDPAVAAGAAECLRLSRLELAAPLPDLGRSLALLRAQLDGGSAK